MDQVVAEVRLAACPAAASPVEGAEDFPAAVAVFPDLTAAHSPAVDITETWERKASRWAGLR